MDNKVWIRDGRLVRVENGGLFLSPGYGRHPTRRLGSFEIILMRSGQMALGEGKRRFVLEPHDALLLLAGRSHRGLSDYDDQTSFYWVHFRLPKKWIHLGPAPKRRTSWLGIPRRSHPARPERLVDLFCQFLHCQEQGFIRPMEADLLVTQMLVELSFTGTRGGGTLAERRMAERVKKIVDAEFHDPQLSPGQVARTLDVNPDYMGRLFKRASGRTLGRYIIQRRLREARKLLLESELNVNQVAQAAGFSDSGYFRRRFHREFDLKPSDLKRLYFRTHVNVR